MEPLLQRLLVLLETRWPLQCTSVEPIKVRENAVYAVHLADGTKVVLRVHRCGYHSDEALMSERTWMTALEEHGIEVPRHVLSKAGRSFETAYIEGFEGERQVDIFHWISGQQLGSVEQGFTLQGATVSEIYRQVGTLAARLHNQSAQWTPPAGFRRHAWDAEGLAGERPFWGRFWELRSLTAAQRQVFVRLRQALWRDLNALDTGADRYGLIHADLVPENVLADGDSLRVIDFDDAGFGWHMFEIATSLYFISRDAIFEQARAAVLEGYRRHRPLSLEDEACLAMFLAARGSTYLGWVHTRAGEPVAEELTPALIEMATAAAEDYLTG